MTKIKIFADGFYYGLLFVGILQILIYNLTGVDWVISRLQKNQILHPMWYHPGWPTVLVATLLILYVVLIYFTIKKLRKS